MKALTKVELDSLLRVAAKHNPLHALMFLVTFNHGLRVSETLSLTRENILNGYLVVQRLKGSKKTAQPLQANEREALLALAQNEGRLFPTYRMNYWRLMQKYGTEAGIPEFKLHPHALKHSTGRLGYEGGMGIPELQTWLGHVNGKNTMVYMEASEEQAANAFAAAVGK
jgi:integrase/recombinase XerD